MNTFTKYLITVLFMLLSTQAFAWTVSQNQFYYDGKASNDKITSKGWQVKNTFKIGGGIDVILAGDPDKNAPGNCPNKINCFTSNCWFSWIPHVNTSDQTGIFLPKYATPKCPDSYWMGFSYFGASSEGFGMRTWTGKKPYDNGGSFWKVNSGQPNKHISAMYGTIYMAPWRTTHMKPWSAPCNGNGCDDKVRVAIITNHEVKKTVMEDKRKMQLQQNMAVTFLQKECFRKYGNRKSCQVQVDLTTLQVGVHSSGEIVIEKHDAAQGGIPWIAGSFKSAGVSSIIPETRQSAWTSWGSATKKGSFGNTRFQAEISWNQFKNILNNVSGYNPVSLFGKGWTNKNNWILLSVSMGQEVYNSTEKRAYIGGNVKKVHIISIAY